MKSFLRNPTQDGRDRDNRVFNVSYVLICHFSELTYNISAIITLQTHAGVVG